MNSRSSVFWKKISLFFLICSYTAEASANVESSAVSADVIYQFNIADGGWQTNAWGQNEKWFRGKYLSTVNAGWYFILPNGKVYSWAGSIAGSVLIAILDTKYYLDPLLLVEAAILNETPCIASSVLSAYQLSEPTWGYSTNARGHNEKYLQGSNFGGTGSGWYFLTPSGTLYHWQGSLSTSSAICHLDAKYYAEPLLIVEALIRSAEPFSALSLDETYHFSLATGGWFQNALGWNEKWFMGKVTGTSNLSWFFILPNGNVYSWDQSTQRRSLIALLDVGYYANPLSLVEAKTDSLSLANAGQIDSIYQLEVPSAGYSTNFFGQGEKYLRGVVITGATEHSLSGWYFITPSGTLYSWNGELSSSRAIAHLGASYYLNPELLTEASEDKPASAIMFATGSPQDGTNLPTPTPSPSSSPTPSVTAYPSPTPIVAPGPGFHSLIPNFSPGVRWRWGKGYANCVYPTAKELASSYPDSLFRTILGRAPQVREPEFSYFWRDFMITKNRHELLQYLWNSTEHRSNQVDALFQLIYHRVGNADELSALVNKLQITSSEMLLLANMLTSEEYTSAHPSTSEFLNAYFNDVLGMKLEPDLQSSLIAQYENSSRTAIVNALIKLPELRRQLASESFLKLLGRSPSAADAHFWEVQLQTNEETLEGLIVNLLATDEFYSLTMATAQNIYGFCY